MIEYVGMSNPKSAGQHGTTMYTQMDVFNDQFQY